MYAMDWNIVFVNPDTGKKYQLMLLSGVEITQSVDTLCDTATILLPEAVLNKVLEIESKVSRGTQVFIDLGYDGNLVREFTGYITEIRNNDSSLKIECEDSIFVFRKQVADEVLKPTSVSEIVQRMIDQIDPSFTLNCEYDIGYEKFVINRATGYDVLKKLQSETKANIYFNSETKTLFVDAPFKGRNSEVKLATDRNVESVSLEYKRAIDRKVEVTIEAIGADGEITSVTSGESGGETVVIKAPLVKGSDLQQIADSELSKRSADRYEGSVDTWLIPVIRPTDTIHYSDPDYADKDGSYYATSVKTSFNESGGRRSTNFGIKLS